MEIARNYVPPPELLGRKRSVNLRAVFNALCYLARSGCQWRLLPKEYPAWQTVYYYFRRWRETEYFVALNNRLRQELRTAVGKQSDASAAIIDSQSVKTDEQAAEAFLYFSMSILMLKRLKL